MLEELNHLDMTRKTLPLLVSAGHLLIFIFLFPQKGSSAKISMAKPGCKETCGNVTIPYPFGIGSGCYLEPRFEITCIVSSNSTSPLLNKSIVVSDISLDHHVLINHSISTFCYANESDQSRTVSSSVLPFSFSHDMNKFVAMGSDIFAFITRSPNNNYTTGCASLKGETLCNSTYRRDCSAPGTGQNFSHNSNQYLVEAYSDDTAAEKGISGQACNQAYPGRSCNQAYPGQSYSDDRNKPYTRAFPGQPYYGSNIPTANTNKGKPYYVGYPNYAPPIIQQRSICYGVYCCETTFPYDLSSFNMQLNLMNSSSLKDEAKNICGYAFIAQAEFYVSYNITDGTRDISPHSTVVPAVLEWAVGNNTCDHAEKGGHCACGGNSSCEDLPGRSGYKCRCLEGYKGNPYLPNGCQDEDECKEIEPEDRYCHEIAKCVNGPGNYSCTCPDGYHGDTSKYGIGCIPDRKLPLALIISLGVGIALGLLIFLALAFWLYKRLEKRKKDLLKRKFFDDNGGRLLRHMMALSKGSVETMTLYLIEDLEKATDNFNANRILGKGGFGTVYKGMLQDGSIVAVKKADKVDEIQVEQFVNEVFILTQIEHSHIVKLLGCCLETAVPLLVYEHVSNGTLSHHLHDKRQLSLLSWENRLRIASEIADALDYLHSYGSAAIFHRDIKPNNILLDENLRAIVADFGISRPVSVKKTHLTASVMQGTYGYLDPEYFQTYQFTSKSDVYAFGVLLAELMTGEKAICMDRNRQGLASHFSSEMKNNNLFEIVDQTLVLNEDQKEEILVVAKIAARCVEPTGNNRPTMKEVAGELQKLRKKVLDQEPIE